MLKDSESTYHNQDDHDVKNNGNSSKPNAYRVDDDKNLEEKDLKMHYLFGSAKMKSTTDPGMEGQGMGGQKFGENNLTPAGNDEANPPQNAGEDNAYFARTQPAEEHPEDSNFEASEPENIGKHPQPQEPYREGTADNDGYTQPEREHIET